MAPETQVMVQAFVASQKTANGYMNAGGHEDAYYGQFGRVLEAVFTPLKVLRLPKQPLVVKESMGRDTLYGQFFDFLDKEMRLKAEGSAFRRGEASLTHSPSHTKPQTTNAVCCVLAMQYQTGEQPDSALVEWLQQRQDQTGGFYASEAAPIPDMLSTAVALFTLRLLGAERMDATPFVQAHWLEGGGFAPTLLDNYSDVEYMFYGLLALGAE